MNAQEQIARALLWKWGRPYSIAGENVEVEGIGPVSADDVRRAHEEWLAHRYPDEVRAEAVTAIDAAADIAARKYITVRAGQEATYLKKAEEAHAHKAAGYPAALDAYPLIAVELEALQVKNSAAVAQEAADYILQTEAALIALAAKIERARRVGHEKVAAAASLEAVVAARNEAVAALLAL